MRFHGDRVSDVSSAFGYHQTRPISLVLYLPLLLLLGVSAAQAQPAIDAVSDRVGATAGQFRVDESGAATYSVPILATPGSGGVAPQMALSYSSQGGNGPLGKGWGISGTSNISRCRSTREHGDFISGGVPVDGDPGPVNFSSSDRFCLDGQRLIPAPAGATACKTLSGATTTNLRTEIEGFSRVCAYTFDALGPRFFTVERKDGSTTWYGDRTSTTGGAAGPRTDGVVDSNGSGKYLSWAQTRFQDSTGNYIDCLYLKNPSGNASEQLLQEVQYTGKVVLTGQTGSASAPYAKITFNYAARPTAEFTVAYASGMAIWQTQKLTSVTVTNNAATVRYYALTYAKSMSGSGVDTLTQVQECSDATVSICYPPTVFDWSVAGNTFTSAETPDDLGFGDIARFEGYKLADVDGDGRQDMVWIKDGNTGDACPTEFVIVEFGSIDAAGRNTFSEPTQTRVCSTTELSGLAKNSWMLFDYNGDGRADLFMSGTSSSSWVLYPSLGRPTSGGKVFNDANNLIATQAIPGGVGPQLADFNGDGQLDVVYKRSGTRYARLMERAGNSFNWGNERTVSTGYLGECSSGPCIGPSIYQDNGGFQTIDFNGDARSDLLLVSVVHTSDCNPQLAQTDSTAQDDTSDQSSTSSTCTNTYDYFLNALVVDTITATNITFKPYAQWWTSENVPGVGGYTSTFIDMEQFADVNGDGLTDMVGRTSSGNWAFWINTGADIPYGGAIPSVINETYLIVQDINGDGRADVLYPDAAYHTYSVRYALPGVGFSAATPAPGGQQLIGCNDNCLDRFSYIFNDLDGDGAVDFFRIKWVTSSGDPVYHLFTSRADIPSRFQPRDTIVRVTNGYGAKTELVYLPLTNAEIYRSDTGSRDDLIYGRGSALQDLLVPTYVVGMARSSAPTFADMSAMSVVYYRYAGAKIQAGGRGFLGFREIVTFDSNAVGQYVATVTQYSQNFPYIGSPVSTIKRVLSGDYVPGACYLTVTNACFLPPGNPFPALTGQVFSNSSEVWETQNGAAFNAGVQEPEQLRVAGTDEALYNDVTGVRTSRVATTFDYDAWGNATLTVADTYTDLDNANPVSVSTSNSYTNDSANWRLGRLTASSVTHTRSGVSVTRNTGFAYAMTGAITGLLNAERLQTGGGNALDSKKLYDLDEYGNRTATYTCSAHFVDSTCKTIATMVFMPTDPQQVRRYSRQTFDAIGRFPVASYEPFWSNGGRVEAITKQVVSRDIFGDVTQATDVNGVIAMTKQGSLGRAYWTWTQSVVGATAGNSAQGIDSTTTYRFCGTGTNQVACPTGAKFRQKVVTDGAPTKWTYFDLLGRPLLATAESFNAGRAGWDFAGTCTYYDATGKTSQVSNPFLLADTAVGGEPVFTSGNPCTGRLYTYTVYDAFGRPTRILMPDGSETSVAYNGLTTVTTNGLGQTKTEVKNALGELMSVTDNLGFVVNYAYDPAGNLASVTRNAGRGAIVTSMGYDVVGRKTSQSDPDAGNWTYTYDAIGELLTQQDGGTQVTRSYYDGRGRVYKKTTESAGVIEVTATTTYDSAANGKGQVTNDGVTGTYAGWVGQSGVALANSHAATYDTLGRTLTTTTTQDGITYPGGLSYDALGRPWRTQDAAGKYIKNEYTARGYVVRVCESSATDTVPTCTSGAPTTYLETIETDARGNVLTETRGGSANLMVKRYFDLFTGRPTEICAGLNCAIADLTLGWDVVGNVKFRDMATQYREEFAYDGLNRLTNGYFTRIGTTTYAWGSQSSQWTSYDALGNICGKQVNGVGRGFTYHGRAGCGLNGVAGTVDTNMTASPHAVMAAGSGLGLTYTYDAHGNQTLADSTAAGADRFIRYSVADQAYEVDLASIAAPSQRTRFWYDVGGNRYKREDIGAGITGTRRTLTIGNLEVITENGATKTRRYVAGVLLQESVGATVTNKYLFTDHLGSLLRVTSDTGSVSEGMDFGAFGERRGYTDPRQYNIPAPASTTKGFTGHEMVDGFDVVHMNGRVYDSKLGRFLQADPIIQDPSNGQNFNRYTYVWNNPLAFTDPSGYMSLRQWGAVIVAVVAAICQQYYISAEMYGAAFAVSIAGGFVAGYVGSGTLKGALIGAFGAGLSFGLSFSGMGASFVGNAIAQGMAGGIVESLQGGNFGHGFLSAGLTAAIMPSISQMSSPVGRVIIGAIVGGTISELTGGKFSNGAISAAVQIAALGAYAKTNAVDAGGYKSEHSIGQSVKGVAAREAYVDKIALELSLYPDKVSYGLIPPLDHPFAAMSTTTKGYVSVYPAAFNRFNEFDFASAMYHEKIHVMREFYYRFAPPDDIWSFQVGYMSEVEAFTAMLDPHRDPYITRADPKFVAQNRKMLEHYRSLLTETNLKSADAGNFNCSGSACMGP